MTLLLTGCKVVVLQPKGIIALYEKHLFIDAFLLMLIVVIPVIILTLVIARRYRASNKKATYSPHWTHSTLLEAGWWAIPIVIIAVLGTMTWRTTHQLNPYKPLSHTALGAKGVKNPTITIEAVALRWKWLFIYPKQDIATVNYIEFPVNTQVKFLITADAPMNSFQIPALGGQIYAMNGMQTKLHLMATHMGSFKGRSVSFSGRGFSGMKFVAKSTTNQAFNSWVSSVKEAPATLTMGEFNRLVQPSINNKPAYYSHAEADLFQKVIASFRTPKTHRDSHSFTGVTL